MHLERLLRYSPILFDFDGLLVDTERQHFTAYKDLVESFGISFHWNFDTFAPIAHESALSIRKALEEAYPTIFENLSWKEFYKRKTQRFCDLIKQGTTQFMPGAEEILRFLIEKEHPFAIVTNSSKKQVELVKDHLPLLSKVPHWFVREHYEKPKPAPDGYLKAMQLLGSKAPIGFEDTKKGIVSLKSAGVKAVLVCDAAHPQRKHIDDTTPFFPTLVDFIKKVGL